MWRIGHQIRVKAKKKRRARATAPKGRRWNAFLEAWCCSVRTSRSLNNSWASPGRPQNPIWWLSAWMCFSSVCYCCLFELLNHKFRSCIIELASRASSKDGYQVWNRQLVNVGGGRYTLTTAMSVCVLEFGVSFVPILCLQLEKRSFLNTASALCWLLDKEYCKNTRTFTQKKTFSHFRSSSVPVNPD